MLEQTIQGAVTVVKSNDPLIEEHVLEFVDFVTERIQIGRPMLVFDMTDVSLINSSGMTALLDIEEQCAARGGKFKIAGTNGLCKDILRITGVSDYIETYLSANDATRSFIR